MSYWTLYLQSRDVGLSQFLYFVWLKIANEVHGRENFNGHVESGSNNGIFLNEAFASEGIIEISTCISTNQRNAKMIQWGSSGERYVP